MKPLDVGRIREMLGARSRALLGSLDVFAVIDSTNTWLMNQPAPGAGRARVAIADYQLAGRGRFDSQWISPPSSGLCLSMAYTFEAGRRDLSSVTLAVGIGIAGMLEEIGIGGIGLKWPNDLIARNAKLGGILTESRSGPAGAASIVIGVGINVALPDVDRITSNIGRVIDISSCIEEPPSRDELSARLIDRLLETLVIYQAKGFESFHASWPKYDWLRGQRVCLDDPDVSPPGVCQGIDADGALIVQRGSDRRHYRSGSIRLFGQDGCGIS